MWQIKKLEWNVDGEEYLYDENIAEAYGKGFTYYIRKPTKDGVFCLTDGHCDHPWESSHNSLEAAKIAAQKEYEAEVKKHLLPVRQATPTPDNDPSDQS